MHRGQARCCSPASRSAPGESDVLPEPATDADARCGVGVSSHVALIKAVILPPRERRGVKGVRTSRQHGGTPQEQENCSPQSQPRT